MTEKNKAVGKTTSVETTKYNCLFYDKNLPFVMSCTLPKDIVIQNMPLWLKQYRKVIVEEIINGKYDA